MGGKRGGDSEGGGHGGDNVGSQRCYKRSCDSRGHMVNDSGGDGTVMVLVD